jgi:hypothetical protein
MKTSDFNPYAPPVTQATAAPPAENQQLREMDFKKLNRLYLHSTSINSLTVLAAMVALSCLALGIASLYYAWFEEKMSMGLIVFAAIYAIIFEGLRKRTNWGRIVGMVACGLSILNISVLSLIGIMGLISLIRTKSLFGDDKIPHRVLKKEYKLRKKYGRDLNLSSAPAGQSAASEPATPAIQPPAFSVASPPPQESRNLARF